MRDIKTLRAEELELYDKRVVTEVTIGGRANQCEGSESKMLEKFQRISFYLKNFNFMLTQKIRVKELISIRLIILDVSQVYFKTIHYTK